MWHRHQRARLQFTVCDSDISTALASLFLNNATRPLGGRSTPSRVWERSSPHLTDSGSCGQGCRPAVVYWPGLTLTLTQLCNLVPRAYSHTQAGWDHPTKRKPLKHNSLRKSNSTNLTERSLLLVPGRNDAFSFRFDSDVQIGVVSSVLPRTPRSHPYWFAGTPALYSDSPAQAVTSFRAPPLAPPLTLRSLVQRAARHYLTAHETHRHPVPPHGRWVWLPLRGAIGRQHCQSFYIRVTTLSRGNPRRCTA